MTTVTISAREAAGLIAAGEAVLVDIREADERARSHVPGSAHAPVSRLGSGPLGIAPGSTVIFHCQSGSRTAQNAPALAAAAPDCRAFTRFPPLSARAWFLPASWGFAPWRICSR